MTKSDNLILKFCYVECVNENDPWICNIKNELTALGLGYIFESNLPLVHTFKIIEQRLKDVTKQNMLAKIAASSKGRLYQYLIDSHCIQFYLRKSIESKYKCMLTKFRTSSHKLNIEMGRHNNIIRRNRNCSKCNLGDVEDEFHFIFVCSFYNDLRLKYIKKYYYKSPSVYKLVQLLSVNNVKELSNLGKYLYLATKRRN